MWLATLVILLFTLTRHRSPCLHWMTVSDKRQLSLIIYREALQCGRYSASISSVLSFSYYLQTSGYALFVDLPDLDMFVVHHLSTFPEWKVCSKSTIATFRSLTLD